MPRVIVLTSTYPRHQFVVNRLADRLTVVGVWQEEKSFQPLTHAITPEDKRVIQAHFDARDSSEAAHFGADVVSDVGTAPVVRVAPGACSTDTEIKAMRALEPEVALVFGTGILKQRFIDAFAGRIINLHLGLSPYYRGAGTNFWPLVNRAPEYVGATIHYLDAGIDTGPIIAHVRPEARPDDGPHELGNRAIAVAADCLAAAAIAHVAGQVRAVPQTASGRLYKRRDFTAAAILALQHNFATGMIADYLADKARLDASLPLVNPDFH
jgi:methionyl-tRNA formyltransferase